MEGSIAKDKKKKRKGEVKKRVKNRRERKTINRYIF